LKCDEIIKDANGKAIELKCSLDLNTLGKNPEGRKVKGVIHWVSSSKSIKAEVRLYDRLFSEAEPDRIEGRDFKEFITPDSLTTITGYVEPIVADAKPEMHFQFERLGYFVTDRFDNENGRLVFNKTVGLKDTWKN
jgi:glutaminyl-tRNA synthetase